MKLFYTLFFSALFCYGNSQIGFETFDLPLDTFLNNSEGDGFTEDFLTFNNSYNSNYMSFSEFAISTMRDTVGATFLNQYSVVSGSGAGGSDTYGIAFSFAGTASTKLAPSGSKLKSLKINNTTYAAKTIENGSAYSKKFGGESGDDPDFFLLTITFYNEGEDTGESIEFYLADYRFEDNSMDYIVKEWTTIEFTDITQVYDELRYSLTSSDVGAYGINTPTYFAVDDFETEVISNKEIELENVNVYPNPVNDFLTVEMESAGLLVLYDILGNMILAKEVEKSSVLNLTGIQAGAYIIQIESQGKVATRKVIKN